MKSLTYTLVPDGSSDRVLCRIIDWVLRRHGVRPQAQFADSRVWGGGSPPLADKVEAAIRAFPADVYFLHRDAERESPNTRFDEITAAVGFRQNSVRAVALVPVRMTEAWFCFDDAAIRRAADNPSGRVDLELPHLQEAEGVPDIKACLHSALVRATEFSSRRRKSFNAADRVHRLAEEIGDFTALRDFPSFRRFERAVRGLVDGGFAPGLYT